MTDIAGNTFATALDIELLANKPKVVTDEIGALDGVTSDYSDYYRFRLSENSTVSLKLSGLSSDAQLYLYDNDGISELVGSNNAGNANELISRNLRPGTYYVLISGGNATTYQLEASTTLIGPVPSDIAGETVEKAKDLGTLNEGGVTVSDFIGDFNGLSQDYTDYYKFQISENSSVELKLSGLSADAQLYLYDNDGINALVGSNSVGNADEFISRNLRAGTYYLQISCSSATTYQLKASAVSLGPVPIDGAGDILDKAKDLGTLNGNSVTVSDFVGDFNRLSQDYTDYYKFQISENSSVELNLSGLSADAQLFLYDNDGVSTIASSTGGGNADEAISRKLRAGTYYLQISGSSATTYQLKAAAIPAQLTDISPFNKATDIKIATKINDSLNIDNLSDYYRFEITENSAVNIKLSGLSAYAYLALYNNDGTRQLGNVYDNVNSTINRDLRAGVYHLLVSGSGGGTTYQLETSATSLGAIPKDLAGERIDQAKDLGVLATGQVTVSDFIGDFNSLSQDTRDYYRFEITENSAVSIKLSGLSAYAYLELYNNDGTRQLGSAYNPNNADSTIDRNLRAGVYHLLVSGSDSSGTTYQLETLATSLGPIPKDLAGERIDQAKDLGVLATDRVTVSDFIGDFHGLSQDTRDYYRFEVTENSAVSIKLSELSAYAYLELYNNDGTRQLGSAYNPNNAGSTINRNLRAGVYYLLVSGSSSGTTYQLETSAIAIGVYQDDAGATLETARDIGILNGSQIFDDFIGDYFGEVQDYTDFYRFELEKSSRVNFAFNGESEASSGYLRLLDSRGRAINYFGVADSLEEFLNKGTYYLQVSPRSSGTKYALTAIGTPIDDFAGDSIEPIWGLYPEAASRLIISLTKHRLSLVVALASVLS
jgi:Bacterial pre-peptidase C-terminal domain